ncbi:MAG: glycosyl hydrolase family 95 catalytic domain-containing protein [Candidatus Cryptobacteroides sp.]
MKRTRNIVCSLIGIFLAFSAVGGCRETFPAYDIEWTEITADPVIQPGQSRRHWGRTTGYYAGALMGNGLLGVNMYKLQDGVYRLNVGRSDVTEARESFSLFGNARLPIGYFTVTTAGEVLSERMRLSLYDARTEGLFTTTEGELGFRTYVHATRDLIVFEADPKGGESAWKWDFVPQEAISPRYVFGNRPKPDEGYLNENGHSNPAPYRITKDGVECLVQPLAADSTLTVIARHYVVAWATRGNRTVATVSQEVSESDAVAKAVQTVLSGLSGNPRRLESEHRQWWHDYYAGAACLTFPDKEIEKFYLTQYYKFACCTRPGKPVVDLQGVWPTVDTPWPAIWMNLNIQLTYSWLTKANLGSFAQPLWDGLWENRENLRRNVTDVPGQEGWTDSMVLPRASTYDFYDPLLPELVQKNCYEVGNLIWTLFYWWQQCRAYGDDLQMTERLFPLLKSAVNMFFHIRVQNPDGTYSLPSTASPEYFSDREIGPNSNYDLANLRWGLTTLLEINDRYALDDPQAAQWKDFLEKLPEFGCDRKTGFKVSDRYEFENTTHRHYSHLFMIYPYHFLDWSDPEDAAMMRLSIDRWNGDTGYSLTGKASMLESMGDGDGALVLLKKFLKEWVRPNTLYSESGPVIETPFSAMCAFEEMYLQDWGGIIRIFPACPSEWKDCSFSGMRADGDFLIGAERRDGRTVCVTVRSGCGGLCRLQADGELLEFEMSPGDI